MLSYLGTNSKNPSKIVYSYQSDLDIIGLVDEMSMAVEPVLIDKLAVQYTNKEKKKVTKQIPLDALDNVYAKHGFDIWLLECEFDNTHIIIRFSNKARRLDIIAQNNDEATVDSMVNNINGDEYDDEEIAFEEQFSDELENYGEDEEAALELDPRGKSGKKKERKPKKQQKSAVKHEGDKSTLLIVFSVLEILSVVSILFGIVSLVKTLGAKKKLGYDDLAAEDGFKSAKLFLIFGAIFIVLMVIFSAVIIALLSGAVPVG